MDLPQRSATLKTLFPSLLKSTFVSFLKLSCQWSLFFFFFVCGLRVVLNERGAKQTCPRKCQRVTDTAAKRHTNSHIAASVSSSSSFFNLICPHYSSLLLFACGKTAVSVRAWCLWHRSHAKSPPDHDSREAHVVVCKGKILFLHCYYFYLVISEKQIVFCSKKRPTQLNEVTIKLRNNNRLNCLCNIFLLL